MHECLIIYTIVPFACRHFFKSASQIYQSKSLSSFKYLQRLIEDIKMP